MLSFDNIRQTKSNALYFLLISVPIAIVSSFTDTDNIIAFTASGIALVPLAKLIGDSTEHLGSHYGSTIGSLLNVTFGNAAELIIVEIVEILSDEILKNGEVSWTKVLEVANHEISEGQFFYLCYPLAF